MKTFYVPSKFGTMSIMLMEASKRHIAAVVLLIFLSGSIGYLIGRYLPVETRKADAGSGTVHVSTLDRYSKQRIGDVEFNLYWDVWDTLKEGYYSQPVDETELFYSSLKGLVDGLGDPYSVFLDPRDATEFSDELSGNFQGIGAEIGIKDDALTIIAPLPNSPAMRAGLLPGDSILAIDDLDTSFITLNEAVRLIRGPEGTDVTLTIVREGDQISDFEDVVVTRGVIHIQSVTTEIRSDGIAVITISNFNDDTRTLFGKAATDILTNASITGIILDLRNNPGGFLDTAVKIAGYWTGDQPVVFEQLSSGARNEYQAGANPVLAVYPTAVLINGGSASASEIVAGALRDYDLATLIGETTFGKGTVQTLEELSDGSSIKYTIAEWLTPRGHSIEAVGIPPDVEIERTREEYEDAIDPQMDAALTFLQE